jgi:carotenoid cleavage dioxygenase
MYRTGAWTPINEELVASELQVIKGEIPADISGIYIRNTENPVHDSMDGNVNYHPFDGDGMLHAIRFKDGQATYVNRFVRTKAFEAEQKAGRALWAGLHEPLLSKGRIQSELPGWGALEGAVGGMIRVKDTASTDVVVHAGRILPTWYLCGEAYAVNLDTLETEGVHPWSPPDGIR